MTRQDSGDENLPPELWPLIEPLAAEVHAAWKRAKEDQGWTLGQLSKQDVTHPDLVDYETLPEEEKYLDRTTVVAVFEGILRRGHRIVIVLPDADEGLFHPPFDRHSPADPDQPAT
jgi:hypothetical protein